jgi:hypothetical protein
MKQLKEETIRKASIRTHQQITKVGHWRPRDEVWYHTESALQIPVKLRIRDLIYGEIIDRVYGPRRF